MKKKYNNDENLDNDLENLDYEENDDIEDEEEYGFEDDLDFDEFKDTNSEKNNKKEYYVKGAELKEEIRKYQESKKTSPDGKGDISEELGLMILKICTRFSMHSKFYRIYV